MLTNSILLIYYYPWLYNAPTIMEHINSFEKYSNFDVVKVNTAFGFPRILHQITFKIIVLHYSLFGAYPFLIKGKFYHYVKNSRNAHKVSFFQDEYQYCRQRFALIDDLGVKTIYTLLEPEYFDQVYLKYTNVKHVYPTLTGYVDDSLVEEAQKHTKPWLQRTIDVGYRARLLPFYMGKGAQEKTEIAKNFINYAKNYDLALDIETGESNRIYGEAWYKYLANCRSVLGVEAGVSIFDLDDTVRPTVQSLLEKNPHISFTEVYNQILLEWEDRIYYRTISPRIFEAAAFKVLQILYEGQYQNILKPNVHYIPLKKDFSNIQEVISKFQDRKFVNQVTEQAYQDLIVSRKFCYQSFIAEFDNHLLQQDIHLPSTAQFKFRDAVKTRILQEQQIGKLWCRIKEPIHKNWPGKKVVKWFLLKLRVLKPQI